jgi:phenylalanyl-tRNA synthetase beta chain
MTDYDISLLFDLSVTWREMFDVILGSKEQDDLIQQASFADEYRGKQVPEGKKSVTIRLVIGSLKKTLTSGEIESQANTVVKRLEQRLGAKLRI